MPPATIGMTMNSDNLEALFNMRYYHVLPTLISMINRARLTGTVDAEISSGVFLYSKSTSNSNVSKNKYFFNFRLFCWQN